MKLKNTLNNDSLPGRWHLITGTVLYEKHTVNALAVIKAAVTGDRLSKPVPDIQKTSGLVQEISAASNEHLVKNVWQDLSETEKGKLYKPRSGLFFVPVRLNCPADVSMLVLHKTR